MLLLKTVGKSLINFAFPHVCEACGVEILNMDQFLCLRCYSRLPATGFENIPDNPFEKIFAGRLDICNGSAAFYFTKNSVIQHLMHQFKYRHHKRLGFYLGGLMGRQLNNSGRFAGVDALLPIPLFAAREKQRGFNQSGILCEGMQATFPKKLITSALIRTASTETQTRKSRIARWQNIKGRFHVVNHEALENKHVLLVDDVVTTGATLEACGEALQKVKDIRLSVGSLCYSTAH